MAKANVILLNSILWNLREVTKLTEKVKKHCGDVDCISWRYPLTSCRELEIFKLLQNNRNLDNYTYILELTYDRLLYLFNLIIKYLESTEPLKKYRPDKNVYRPKTLSLAAVLHMIWDRIQAQTESISQTSLFTDKTEESERSLSVVDCGSKTSIYTQSEISSISLCSCCEMVQQFVTQLVLEMEKVLDKQEFCSAISAERKIMRESLVEMTNWSAMSRWLTAIIKDITSLKEKVDQTTSHSRKLKSRLESGEKKFKFKTEQQEEETKKLETRLKDQESKISDLKHNLEKLTEERNSIKEQLKQKSLEIVAQNSEFEIKISDLKKSHENKLRKNKEKKLKIEKEKEELKENLEVQTKKFQEFEEKNRELEEKNKELEKSNLELQENLKQSNSKFLEDQKDLKSKLQDKEKEIEHLKQENISLNSIIEEKEKKIKDYSMRILEAFPELHPIPQPKFKASGIPEIDMESQIEANNIRIDLLQTENLKLQKTLQKIKSLKG